MNQQMIEGKWKEIKGEIQSKWGQLTNDDLEQTKGNIAAIGGLIQQKYGSKKEEVKTQLDSLVNKFLVKTDSAKKDVEEKAADASERIKDDMQERQ